MPIRRRPPAPQMPTRTFPQRVRKMMIEKSLNQSEVARNVGYTPTGVWNWLQGNTLPRAETLSSLANLFGVSEEWLRDGDPEETEKEKTADSKTQESIADKVENLRIEVAEITGYLPEQINIKLEFNNR